MDAGKSDAGADAGYDAGTTDAGCAAVLPCTPRVNACGMNCGCITDLQTDGGLAMIPYCDPDVGNPCMLGCFNPKEADGGRRYMGGTPVCFC